ncbi:hypothetical protein SUGI_0857380 [Cryptomeria japonica]|nr:hypothetical protein SUGI_0857380 [Cryptomeria japonica]
MDRPSINIGAIIAFDTVNGKIARTAIELAVEEVNRNTGVLNGTLLNIHIRGSTQDALTGASAGNNITYGCLQMSVAPLELLRKGCVSIVGPQTSVVDEFVAHLGVAAHIPIVTFAATNPSLSMHRHPYFIRMAPSDTIQMRATAELIRNYRWRDVGLVYVDDDWGTGVIPALNDALRDVEAKIIFKAAVSPRADISAMQTLLQDEVMKLASRVFNVHLHPDLALSLFSEAYKLGIISSDYVWIITDGLASLLNSINATSLLSMNGVLGVKRNLTQTDESRLNTFNKRWKQRFKAQSPTIPSLKLNSCALVAYDTVWAIAIAIDNLLRMELFNVSFSAASTSTNGVSRKTPRGCVKPVPGQKLKIGVPWQPGFAQLVSVKPVHANTVAQNQTYEITGFCIDVLKAVLRRLDYELLHELIPYGSGNITSGYYDDLVYQVYIQKFDAVVGDVSVIANRSKYLDFTQPYTETGLIMVAAIAEE